MEKKIEVQYIMIVAIVAVIAIIILTLTAQKNINTLSSDASSESSSPAGSAIKSVAKTAPIVSTIAPVSSSPAASLPRASSTGSLLTVAPYTIDKTTGKVTSTYTIPTKPFVPSTVQTSMPAGSSRYPCLNLGIQPLVDGAILLTEANQIYTDPQNNPAILICGYTYDNVPQINIAGLNLNVYCDDGNIINGNGYNRGFNVNSGSENVQIRNCRIQNFFEGIAAFGTGKITFDSNTFDYVKYGITYSDQPHNTVIKILNNNIRAEIMGVFSAGGWGNEISDHSIINNKINASINNNGWGIYSFNELVESNTVSGFTFGIVGGNINRIRRNTIGRSELSSVLYEGQTSTFSIGGLDYEVTLIFASVELNSAKFYVNGEITREMHPGDVKVLSNSIRIYLRAIYQQNGVNMASFDIYQVQDNGISLWYSNYWGTPGGNTLEVSDNKIQNVYTGIYLSYGQPSDLSTNRYYIIGQNIVRNTVNGIVIDGSNVGAYFPSSKVQYNAVTNSEYVGLFIYNDAQGISVNNNQLFISREYALKCYRTGGVTWSCNNCNGGALQNDQCNPLASCQACVTSPPNPPGGASPIYSKSLVIAQGSTD